MPERYVPNKMSEMKITILTIFICFSIIGNTFCQKLEFDYSEKLIPRDSNDERQLMDRIVSQEIRNDTLLLLINTFIDCEGVYDMNVQKKTDDTLCFSFHEGAIYKEIDDSGDTVVRAICSEGVDFFEYSFIIPRIKSIPVILWNDSVLEFSTERFKTFPISYYIKQNDTINYSDKYGLRQGVWILIDKDSVQIRHYFKDNNLIKTENVKKEK